MYLSFYIKNFAYLLVFGSINPTPISDGHKAENKARVWDKSTNNVNNIQSNKLYFHFKANINSRLYVTP